MSKKKKLTKKELRIKITKEMVRALDRLINPTSFGECIWSVSIEELYQHFKQRFIEELEEDK